MPPPTYLLTPRLRPFEEDRELFQHEPFLSVFSRYRNARHSRRYNVVDQLFQEIRLLLSSEPWSSLSTEFVSYCLGAELVLQVPGSFDRQLRFLTEILFLRFCHQDSTHGLEMCEKVLLDAQLSWSINSSEPFPTATVSVQMSLAADIRRREDLQDDSEPEASEAYSDLAEDEPDASPASGGTSDIDDSEYEDDESPPSVWSIQRSSFVLESSESQSADLPDAYRWSKDIEEFFFPSQLQNDEQRSPKGVVDGLAEMRKVRRRRYQSQGFREDLQDSGLLARFLHICLPGNLLETTHPDVEISFRFYNWRIGYGEMLCRWTPPTRLVPLEITAKQPNYPFDPVQFLCFFSANPRMHPWRSNPMAVYLFLSQSAFKINCRIWLIPCLEALGFEAIGWDLEQVYRDLLRHPAMQNEEDARHLALDARLLTVITESALHRRLIKALNYTVFHPIPLRIVPTPPGPVSTPSSSASSTHLAAPRPPLSKVQRKNVIRREKDRLAKAAKRLKTETLGTPAQARINSCPGCAHKPEVDWCIRTIPVRENPNASKYLGYSITCAHPNDRLKPKRSRRYISPVELGLRWVEARPASHSVWADCGRDIVRFVHRRKNGQEVMVGGVRFKALSPENLKIMQDNHQLVRIRAIRRSADMQAWAYGSMTATGSRMPIGGWKGDGYAPYACHSGDSVEDIQALFRHAVDTDILVTAAKSIYPKIEHDLLELTEDSELNRFGRFGSVAYYCTNFISCVHSDKDIVKEDHPTLHPCIQLSKKNCGPDDYNFAMVRWGIAIRTEENTVWVFDGTDEHGTIMPSQSAVDHGAVSTGMHNTNNIKDVKRATAYRDVRHGYDLRRT
ncbi:hypothetical protein B0H11DRAFT_1967892 [Mycena galericulata]|nr:hypothetical protein B0H11DRAFT_1967892 [Mycena galericulata]